MIKLCNFIECIFFVYYSLNTFQQASYNHICGVIFTLFVRCRWMDRLLSFMLPYGVFMSLFICAVHLVHIKTGSFISITIVLFYSEFSFRISSIRHWYIQEVFFRNYWYATSIYFNLLLWYQNVHSLSLPI